MEALPTRSILSTPPLSRPFPPRHQAAPPVHHYRFGYLLVCSSPCLVAHRRYVATALFALPHGAAGAELRARRECYMVSFSFIFVDAQESCLPLAISQASGAACGTGCFTSKERSLRAIWCRRPRTIPESMPMPFGACASSDPSQI